VRSAEPAAAPHDLVNYKPRAVRCSRVLCSTLLAKKRDELFDRDARLPNQRAQSSLRELSMIWNGKAAMGRLAVPENDVAALLPIDLVPEAPERGDSLKTGNARKDTHTATSMTSSWMAGGIGSFRSRRLSR
jgi:hypothetical protein